jgi:hypothetical protein
MNMSTTASFPWDICYFQLSHRYQSAGSVVDNHINQSDTKGYIIKSVATMFLMSIKMESKASPYMKTLFSIKKQICKNMGPPQQ